MSQVIVALGFVGIAAAACGGGSSGGGGGGGSTPSAQPNGSNVAGATAAIKTLYAEFFTSPPATAATLLQNGSSLSKTIAIADKLKAGATESAKVSKVTFPSPTQADVIYSLSNNGSVVLPSASGEAVYVDGKWLFSSTTFCTLVGLGEPGKKLPGCS